MAENQQSQRQSIARTQLEAGLPAATVTLRLQVRFRVSRATAYRDVAAASAEIQASDDGPATGEPPDYSGLLATLLHDAQRCLAEGDAPSAAKLISAADKVKRWQGSLVSVPADETYV